MPSVRQKKTQKHVHTSQDGERGCICMGKWWIQQTYIPEQLSKRAKQPRTAFGRNHNFCDFDPPGTGVRNWTKQVQCGLDSLHLHYYDRHLRGINERLPVGVATSEIVPTHLGGEVGKSSPNRAKSSGIPSHLWVYQTPRRAKEPLVETLCVKLGVEHATPRTGIGWHCIAIPDRCSMFRSYDITMCNWPGL